MSKESDISVSRQLRGHGNRIFKEERMKIFTTFEIPSRPMQTVYTEGILVKAVPMF